MIEGKGNLQDQDKNGGGAGGMWYRNPIVLLAFAMLGAIVLLIGATTLGWDKGLVLTRMGQVEFARGLITYLFAVVTIGTAVVLVVSALTADETPANERRFERGKEILSLLLGVFGTIVGFYFGSEVAAKGQTAEETIVKIAPLRLNPTPAVPGAELTITTFISGGKAPYKYGVGFGKEDIKPEAPADPSGWIVKTLTSPKSMEGPAVVRLVVEDADGHSTEASAPLGAKANP